MPRYRPRRNQPSSYHTTVEIKDIQHDVEVHYRINAPEPDVGEPGGVEVESVWFEDQGCLMGEMSDDQIEDLEHEIAERETSSHEAAADHAYDDWKDRQMEDRD